MERAWWKLKGKSGIRGEMVFESLILRHFCLVGNRPRPHNSQDQNMSQGTLAGREIHFEFSDEVALGGEAVVFPNRAFTRFHRRHRFCSQRVTGELSLWQSQLSIVTQYSPIVKTILKQNWKKRGGSHS